MKKPHPELLKFLKFCKLMVIATVDHESTPWVCNVYYSVTNDFKLFFVSPTDSLHSKHIAQNSRVAFSIPWYDENDLGNRKAVQGIGVCTRVTNWIEAARFLRNHYIYYPLWKKIITTAAMRKKLIESRPYIIKPEYMKFWNDELFGDEGIEEYTF